MSYKKESELSPDFTEKNNNTYTRIARSYDFLIKVLPIWKNWITTAIPHIQGNKVLEVSFGTGLLLTKYADQFETYGIDYNTKMVEIANRNLKMKNISATLAEGNVEKLPFDDNVFDSIINTMAFTGYPDGDKAMSEFHRVLKPQGRLIIVDINFPNNMNLFGTWLTKLWITLGDIVRDMSPLFNKYDFNFTDQEVGGFGSVHLYVATKSAQ